MSGLIEEPVAAERPAEDEDRSSRRERGAPTPLDRLRRLLRAAVRRPLPLVLLAAMLGVGGGLWYELRPEEEPAREVAYTALLADLRAGRVAELTVRPGRDVRGTLRPGAAEAAGVDPEFSTVFPVADVDALAEAAGEAGTPLKLAHAPDPGARREGVMLGVQLLLLGALGWLLFRQLRGGNGMSELGSDAGSATTFADVAGTQGAAEELREMVEFLRHPDAFAAVGARIPKGALLVGPPGTGKTLLARAVAGEAGVPFFSISGSEVTGFLVGMGAQRVRSLFRRARKEGGVVFIDEIDALGGKRGRNRSHNEDDRTLNQLLVEMDGFSPLDGVVVIGATNRPEDLDEALKRPGRFDRIVQVGAPSQSGREEILRLHADRRGVPLAADVDLGRLARLTPGSTGAELANLLNEAAIAAARAGEAEVRWRHVETARDRALLGKERAGFRALDEERRVVATHEAGHALAGVLHCPEDGLHKVTIQARGQALGVAFFAPDDDRSLYRRAYLEGQIVKGLAGRAAEELVFGHAEVTSGAQGDLQHVNGIARRMVRQLGMGEETGLLFDDGEPGSLSLETQARMDREVAGLLRRLYGVACETLERHRPALEALAAALLERETLDGWEALQILERAGVELPRGLARGASPEPALAGDRAAAVASAPIPAGPPPTRG